MATFTSNGTPITQPSPQYDLPIYCNNGKISVLDHTNWNVITNPTSQTGQGMFISTEGKLSRANDRGAGVFIPVTVGKKYTVLINRRTVDLGTIIRYGQSNNGSVPNSAEQLLDWYRGTLTDGMIISFTAKRPYFVMQLSANLVEATGGVDNSVEIIEAAGDNETIVITDENNTTVGTATANNLFAIDTTKDVQEIITGATTHNCRVAVLTGQETGWMRHSTYYWFYNAETGFDFPASRVSVICSVLPNLPTSAQQSQQGQFVSVGHNNGTTKRIIVANNFSAETTVADFKQWLADLYAAGTPLIVVYPATTPYTEPAPIAQSMTVVDGDNTVSLTQQGMTPLTLEATYTQQQ